MSNGKGIESRKIDFSEMDNAEIIFYFIDNFCELMESFDYFYEMAEQRIIENVANCPAQAFVLGSDDSYLN